MLWGFHSPGCAKVAGILSKHGLAVDVWVGDRPECTHNIFEIINLNFDYSWVRSSCPEYEKIYGSISVFIEMYSRHSKKYANSVYHDFVNSFYIYSSYFQSLLEEKRIQAVFFSNIPHEGPDFIVYTLAKIMGIRVFIFTQSIFPNKYFIIDTIEDYGVFNSSPHLENSEKAKIEKTHRKNLVYMKNYQPYKYGIRELLANISKFRRDEIFFGLWKYKRFQKYKKNLDSLAKAVIPSDVKYVYFPLHLQPEMTTAALGGMYSDQICALEKLSCLLPEGWLIYIKENPKQTEYMRDNLFFRRLRRLRNVRLVSIDSDTYQLISKSQFVATITGTAGWEAITGGKCALIFGNAWYSDYPGVFRYQAGLDLNRIANTRINHMEVESHFNMMINKMGVGVVDELYSTQVNNYHSETNNLAIAQTIVSLINSI